MKVNTLIRTMLLSISPALAQVTIPATNGSLPAAGANGCTEGYYPGTDTVLFTVPYTYPEVISIIGNFTNLTWSGAPENSVTANSTEFVPGTARFYTIEGAHIIETLTTYSKSAAGPYVEAFTVAPATIASRNFSFYSDFDGQIWSPICGGLATTTNFTIHYCATNVTAAGAALHEFHLFDAMNVGTFLGGHNFTSCAALEGGGANGTSTPTTTV